MILLGIMCDFLQIALDAFDIPGRVIQSAVRWWLQYLHLKLHVQMECQCNISNILITWGNHYDGMAT